MLRCFCLQWPVNLSIVSGPLQTLCLSCAAVGILSGCAEDPPNRAAPVNQQPTVAGDDHSKQKKAQEVQDPNEPQPSKEQPVAGGSPQRILLFAPRGPLLLDIWLSLDGRAHDEPIREIIQRVLESADSNGDGSPTWSEWSTNQTFFSEQAVFPATPTKRQLNEWIKQYDENEDHVMQEEEAAAWLGRDRRRSARALQLRSSRSYGAHWSTQSRLWQILDSNADASLTEEELGLVSERLLQLDTNNDDMVENSEMSTLRDLLVNQDQRPSRFSMSSNRRAAMLLTSRSEAGNIDYLLSDLYAPRQQLKPASFGPRRKLFKDLDSDEDSFLDRSELEALVDIAPHLKISVAFFTNETKDVSPTSRLKLLEQSDIYEEANQPSPNRIQLSIEDVQLNISSHDLGVNRNEESPLYRKQITLMIHDRVDRLFEILDKNTNGKLGEREIATARERLQQFDTNRDGQIQPNELSSSMILAFLRSEPSGRPSYYTPVPESFAEQFQGIPQWFPHADLNNDGDVSRKEFIGSTVQFESLDANNDGFITHQEAVSLRVP